MSSFVTFARNRLTYKFLIMEGIYANPTQKGDV